MPCIKPYKLSGGKGRDRNASGFSCRSMSGTGLGLRLSCILMGIELGINPDKNQRRREVGNRRGMYLDLWEEKLRGPLVF